MSAERCSHCGTPQAATSQKFCEECGKPLTQTGGAKKGSQQRQTGTQQQKSSADARKRRREDQEKKRQADQRAWDKRRRETEMARKAKEDERTAAEKRVRDEVSSDPSVRKLRDELKAAERAAREEVAQRQRQEAERRAAEEATKKLAEEQQEAKQRLDDLRRQQERERREAETNAKKLEDEMATAEARLRLLREEQDATDQPSPNTFHAGSSPTEEMQESTPNNTPDSEKHGDKTFKLRKIEIVIALVIAGLIVADMVRVDRPTETSDASLTNNLAVFPPEPPTTPTLRTGATGELVISWTTPGTPWPIMNYRIDFFNDNSPTALITSTFPATNSTTARFTDLDNVGYRVAVMAENKDGWSGWSGRSNQVTPTQTVKSTPTTAVSTTTSVALALPRAPTKPTLTVTSSSHLRAQWYVPPSSKPPATKFEVAVYKFDKSRSTVYWTSSTSLTIPALDGEGRAVKVRSTNKNGWGPWSPLSDYAVPVRATTTAAPPTTTYSRWSVVQQTVLLATYPWMTFDPKVKELQALLGLAQDGYYGTVTRARHVITLQQAKLTEKGVPSLPPAAVTTTTSGYTHPSSLAAPTTGTIFRKGDSYTVTVRWNPPSQTGSSPIDKYEIRVGSEIFTYEATARAVTFTIPSAGTYTFEVRAINGDNRAGKWSPRRTISSSSFPAA